MINDFEFLEGGSLYTVSILSMRFKIYKPEYLDSPFKDEEFHAEKEWYLIGDTILKEKSKELNYKDPVILTKLLELGKIIYEDNALGNEEDETSQLAYTDEIIRWCNEFGLPYSENYLFKTYGFHKLGFGLWDFKIRLLNLYKDYHSFIALEHKDTDKIKKFFGYYSALVDLNSTAGIDFLKDILAKWIWGGSEISLKLTYNKSSKTYEMIPYTDDYIRIAYFQIGMLMAGNGNVNIKPCTKCGGLFYFKHGNKDYCVSCEAERKALNQKDFQKRLKNEIIKKYFEGIPIEEISEKYKKTSSQINKWIKELNYNGIN